MPRRQAIGNITENGYEGASVHEDGGARGIYIV